MKDYVASPEELEDDSVEACPFCGEWLYDDVVEVDDVGHDVCPGCGEIL